MAVVVLFERCLTARTARVSKLQKKPTSKWRPLPLTTVELQKLGSMFLRMDSQRVMKVINELFGKSMIWLTLVRLPKTFTIRAGSATREQKPILLIKASISVNWSRSKSKTKPGVLTHKGTESQSDCKILFQSV